MLSVPKVMAESSGPIFFSELMWRGSSASTADEWIELYNSSDRVIDLSGYEIFDEIKSKTMVQISEGQIAPHGNFLISNYGSDSAKSILNIEPDIVDSGLNLSNTELRLLLIDASGKIIDTAGEPIDADGKGAKPPFGEYCVDKVCQIASMAIDNNDFLPVWSATTTRQNLDSNSEEYATPCNSGRPIIKGEALSSNIFLLGKANNYTYKYVVLDSGDDFKEIIFNIYEKNGNLADEKRILAGKSKITLDYDFCPIVKAIFVDGLGLSSSRDLGLKCSQLNDKVIISEIMPHPSVFDWNKDGKADSNDEFIEISNSSTEDLQLDGWLIKDLSGKEFLLDGLSIKAKSFLVLFKKLTKLSINDKGDSIFLIDPSNRKASVVNIPKSSTKRFKDASFGLVSSKWQWSKKVTPGNNNILIKIEEPEKSKVENKPIVDDNNTSALPPDANIVNAIKLADKQTNQQILNKIIKVTTTTRVAKSIPATLTSSQIKPVVLGSRAFRNPPMKSFIRLEYLLYFFGFGAFLILVFCYEFCRRE